jgi:hypothetical protein
MSQIEVATALRELAEAMACLVEMSDDEFAAAVKDGPELLRLLPGVLSKLRRAGWGASQLAADLEVIQERAQHLQPVRH